MTRNFVLAIMLPALGLSGLGLSAAYADSATPTLGPKAVLSAPIKLDQAGAIALKAVPGTLADIGFGQEKGTGIYEASVMAADGSLTEVTIDAQSGKVLNTSSAAAQGQGADPHREEGEMYEANEGASEAGQMGE